MSKSPLVLDAGKPIVNKNIEKDEPIIETKEIEEKIKTKIPNDYIKIKLSTNGRLDTPKVLHFRDFSMDDALELNVLDEEDRLKAIISVLNNMVYEDFDCSKLHIKELMEILYTIHGTFINSKLEKEYPLNEDLPEGNKVGQLFHADNIRKIEVNLAKLSIQNIDETYDGKNREKKFKEPFTIIDGTKKTKMKFRLSRVGDLLFAQEYCNTLYEKEVLQYRPLRKAIEKLKDVEDLDERQERLEIMIDESEDAYESYMKFLQKKDITYIKVIQALQIVEIEGKELSTIEDKLEAYKNNVSETVWPYYNEIVNEYNFGIIDRYSFFCEDLQKNISRRLSFQLLDFLPDIEQDYSKRYTVSFD